MCPLSCYFSSWDAQPPPCLGTLTCLWLMHHLLQEALLAYLLPSLSQGTPLASPEPCSPHHSTWHHQLSLPVCLLNTTLSPPPPPSPCALAPPHQVDPELGEAEGACFIHLYLGHLAQGSEWPLGSLLCWKMPDS